MPDLWKQRSFTQIHCWRRRRDTCGFAASSCVRRRWRSCGAFTLIELLVVIAIIAILAAILFPVYARVKENAKKTTCLSNIAQIGKALKMYTDDHDGHYPLWYMGARQNIYWWAQVAPYGKDERIYVCPADPKPREYYNMGLKLRPVSYGFNYHLYHQGEYTYTAEVVEQAFQSAGVAGGMANLPVVADCSYFHFMSEDKGRARLHGGARHLGSLNILFGDGHAKNFRESVIDTMMIWPGEGGTPL